MYAEGILMIHVGGPINLALRRQLMHNMDLCVKMAEISLKLFKKQNLKVSLYNMDE